MIWYFRNISWAFFVVPFCAASMSVAQDAAAPKPDAQAPQAAPPAPATVPAKKPKDVLTSEARYRKSKNLFQFGDCAGVLDTLRPYTLRAAGKPRSRLVEAHRMLGVCYYQLGRLEESNRELNSLLYLDPDHVLDPLVTPPPLIERFSSLKTELSAKLTEIKRARDKRAQSRQNSSRTIIKNRVVQRHAAGTILLPFGLPQFSHGQNAIGVTFVFLQAVPLVINVISFAGLQLMRRTQVVESPEIRLALDYGFWIAHLAAAGAFGAAYMAGVVHAAIWLPEEKVLESTEKTILENAEDGREE